MYGPYEAHSVPMSFFNVHQSDTFGLNATVTVPCSCDKLLNCNENLARGEQTE